MEIFTNEEQGFQLWLGELLASHESLQSNPLLATFLETFLNRVQEYHKSNGNQVLYCRGQQRILVSLEEAAKRAQQGHRSVSFGRWYDFVQLNPHSRFSGYSLDMTSTKRRFETLCIKVQASRNRARFGMTDDTGYLFPCLQQNIPRAFFLVMDHVEKSVFVIHGNKKFAGQGDDGMEEGSSEATTTDIHAPPAKCFPGTENLQPTHYIFTWKANGKNAGVYGYTAKNGQLWLFVNSKGVCECAGLLEEIIKSPRNTTFSEISMNDDMQLPRLIFACFAQAWNDGLNHEVVLSLWKRGYMFLFELCDNKHVVLEWACGRPVDHLAFIGLVKLPELGTSNTVESGLVFRVDETFTFDLWRGALQGPPQTCKPTVNVKVEDLAKATQELMKGCFFPKDTSTQWFDPNATHDASHYVAGEGAVCYEMAQTETGDAVIRQLFKAKTATYITDRQYRGFLQRGGKKEVEQFNTFQHLHKAVRRFVRQKFGDLAAKPYPDPKEFCIGQSPEDVVTAAALFYTHFGMYLQDLAITWNSSVAALVGILQADCLLPLDSPEGQKYMATALKMGLLREDVLQGEGMVSVRYGMAFRIAEFCINYSLDHAKIFAAPKEMIHDLAHCHAIDVPTGYTGTIIVGFNHVFPGGVTPQLTKAEKKKQKQKNKKRDILEESRRDFMGFLVANPNVKIVMSDRNKNPDEIVFESPATNNGLGGVLLSSSSQREFKDALFALPDLGESISPRLEEDEALLQAEAVLRQAFPTVESLFASKAEIQLGDVQGRLVPIIQDSLTKKKLLIIRGVSGIGKSTVARAFQSIYGADQCPRVEADDYFGPTCPYHHELLSEAHEDAQNRARQALDDDNVLFAIASNTGTTAHEYAEYLDICVEMNASASILTLDTATSLESLRNLHEVDQEKVKKMARNLRNPQNNPEGKTLDQIFEIAQRQSADDNRFVSTATLAWNLLGNGGVSIVRDIYIRFLQHAKEEGITVSSKTNRPDNPHATLAFVRAKSTSHATLAFVRAKSTPEELKQMADLWDKHGTIQEMELGEVRYSTREVAGSPKVLNNVAVQVKSFSPNLVDLKTPHITIAFHPDHASAVDSNKLWQSETELSEGIVVCTWDPKLSASQSRVSGIIETGALRGNSLKHELPDWLKKHVTTT